MTASDLIECQEAYASLRRPTLAAPLPPALTALQDFSCFPSLLKRRDCTFCELYLTFSTNLMAFQFAWRGRPCLFVNILSRRRRRPPAWISLSILSSLRAPLQSYLHESVFAAFDRFSSSPFHIPYFLALTPRHCPVTAACWNLTSGVPVCPSNMPST